MKVFYLFLFIVLISFGKSGFRTPEFIQSISNSSEFAQLASDPITNKYSEVTSVKVVYDLKTQKIYYINSAYYKFHYEFCQAEIDERIYLGKFNEDNYSIDSPNRRYLLGNINYFKHLDRYALELSPSDYMSVAYVEQLIQEIKKSVFFKENFSLMLSTERLNGLKNKFTKGTSFLTQEQIYDKMISQIVVPGNAVGRLVFVEDLEEERISLQPTDIIVINETPLVLPNVAGIIVAEFQTPLSHLSILGKNRGVPVLALKEAFTNKELMNLKGQNVEMILTMNQYTFRKSDKKTKTYVSPGSKLRLKGNLQIDSLISIEELSRHAEDYVGNKANNFGMLYQLSLKNKFKTPESAFAIPFHFYAAHLEKSGANDKLKKLFEHPELLNQPEILSKELKSIRSLIKNTPIDPVFLSAVETKIKSLGTYERMRFRSSTNAEDAKGFSGAGLYDSKTGEIDNPDKSIEEAIQKVWASLWSESAYLEREYFNIDQSTVFMGILVHRSFPNEEVNGVIITKNLYRKDYLGFVVNAQLGEESVVKPKANVICDQFICYPRSTLSIQPDETIIDVISRSSLNNGKLVMTENEIQLLADEVEKIKMNLYRRFGRRYLYENFGLDLEFKLDAKTRQLYIKQFRFYND